MLLNNLAALKSKENTENERKETKAMAETKRNMTTTITKRTIFG